MAVMFTEGGGGEGATFLQHSVCVCVTVCADRPLPPTDVQVLPLDSLTSRLRVQWTVRNANYLLLKLAPPPPHEEGPSCGMRSVYQNTNRKSYLVA